MTTLVGRVPSPVTDSSIMDSGDFMMASLILLHILTSSLEGKDNSLNIQSL